MQQHSKAAVVAALVSLLAAGSGCLWTVFHGALWWAHTGTWAKAALGATGTVVCFVVLGIFLSFLLFPERVRRDDNPFDNAKPSNRIPYPKAGEGSTPPRPPRDFEVSNDRGEGNFDVRDIR